MGLSILEAASQKTVDWICETMQFSHLRGKLLKKKDLWWTKARIWSQTEKSNALDESLNIMLYDTEKKEEEEVGVLCPENLHK